MRREDGWKNYHMSCGCIEPYLVDQHGNPLFDDIRSRGCYSFRNGLSDAKDQLI